MSLLKRRKIKFNFWTINSLTEIKLNATHIYFVYEYCLSVEFLRRLDPDKRSIIVNLHNWNGDLCISKDAYNLADKFEVTLQTTDEFQKFVRDLQ